jgi:hypothetical protein
MIHEQDDEAARKWEERVQKGERPGRGAFEAG